MSEPPESLLIDRETPIQRPSPQQIQQWASHQRVFISSTMADLAPARQQVARTIGDMGAEPVMFETLGARSDDSRQAYLSEVRRSPIYLGILSQRYGVRLPSGYSATHEEYEEARKHRRKEILLFLDSSIPDSERDGHLNTWIRELYQFHVLGKYQSVADLTREVQTSLEEIARDVIAPWVKLDSLIFQATRIETNTQGHGTTFTFATATRDARIINALTEMAQAHIGRQTRRLTFQRRSIEVEVEQVNETIDPLNCDALVLTCKTLDERYQRHSMNTFVMLPGGYRSPTREYTYRDLLEIALRSVALGQAPPADPMLRSVSPTDFQTLYQQYGDDARVFPKIAHLLIVEALYQHELVSNLEVMSVGPIREDRMTVFLSAIPARSNLGPVDSSPLDIEGEINLR